MRECIGAFAGTIQAAKGNAPTARRGSQSVEQQLYRMKKIGNFVLYRADMKRFLAYAHHETSGSGYDCRYCSVAGFEIEKIFSAAQSESNRQRTYKSAGNAPDRLDFQINSGQLTLVELSICCK
jgi:hypothetical protein